MSLICAVCLVTGAQASSLKNNSKDHEVSIRLTSKGDEIAFSPTLIEARVGQKIKITFVNEAAKDSGIDHNLAILRRGTLDRFIVDLQKVGYNLPDIVKNSALIHMSRVLKPGEKETFEFSPEQAGSYPYLCLMAGHGDVLNMRGTIEVK